MMTLLASTYQTWWIAQHLSVLVFIFAFGGCVGSFLNVVIYRLPAGMGVINPPSRCPVCGGRIRFHSRQHSDPQLVSAARQMPAVQGEDQPAVHAGRGADGVRVHGVVCRLYMVPLETPVIGAIGGEWWYSSYRIGFFSTWPAFIALSFLLAALFAMT
jgi:hypothetical protein